MKDLSVYIFSAIGFLTAFNLMYAEKDGNDDGSALTSLFQYEQNEKEMKEKRNDPSVFRRKLLNVLSGNKTAEAEDCDDANFCQSKLNGSDGAIDLDYKNNSSKSSISFRISKNETVKLFRKAAGRYDRAATKPCNKRKNKEKFSNYEDEDVNNYDVNDEDQDADLGNDEDQDAYLGNEEQSEEDIDFLHGFDENDDNDKALDDQDDNDDLDVDDYDDNELSNTKGKGKRGKGKKNAGKDYDTDNKDNYNFYDSNNDKDLQNEDYDDIFDNDGNHDDDFNDDEGGESKVPEDGDYDEDDNGIGGVPEDTDYDYHKVQGTSGKPEQIYDYDHYDYYYDHTDKGQRKEETEYDDSDGDGFYRTQRTEIPGGLGKYFVYVNCTSCKIKSQLVVLAGNKTSKPPKAKKITTMPTKRRSIKKTTKTTTDEGTDTKPTRRTKKVTKAWK